MCKYIIVGKAASGKDTTQNWFVERGFKPLRQFTTRPQRHNETGEEYHFVSEKSMKRMMTNNKFVSVRIFNDWYYGFTLDDLKKCDVAILSVGNIEDLNNFYPEEIRLCTIIYLDIPYEIRKKRLKSRYKKGKEDDPLERRMDADEVDFRNFNTYDIRFTSNEDVQKFINKISK